MSDQVDTLSVQQAAIHFGVTEKTIRRRIKGGSLSAQKVSTSQGYEWRVQIDGQSDQVDTHATGHLDRLTGQVDTHPTAPELMKALEMVDRLQRDNQQLAGQVGYLQRQVQEQQETIQRLLMPPKDDPAPTEPEQKRAWWKVWGRR
jgi:hypothetical protein